jgi:hypothetical protein
MLAAGCVKQGRQVHQPRNVLVKRSSMDALVGLTFAGAGVLHTRHVCLHLVNTAAAGTVGASYILSLRCTSPRAWPSWHAQPSRTMLVLCLCSLPRHVQ